MRGSEGNAKRKPRHSPSEAAVPPDHPLRPIRAMADAILEELSPELSRIYSPQGRPSIPPEKLLRALLLQVLYGLNSERLLLALLEESALFRWFVGLESHERVWHATTLTKNRARLRDHDVARRFFDRVQKEAMRRDLLSKDDFASCGNTETRWSGQFPWAAPRHPQPM